MCVPVIRCRLVEEGRIQEAEAEKHRVEQVVWNKPLTLGLCKLSATQTSLAPGLWFQHGLEIASWFYNWGWREYMLTKVLDLLIFNMRDKACAWAHSRHSLMQWLALCTSLHSDPERSKGRAGEGGGGMDAKLLQVGRCSHVDVIIAFGIVITLWWVIDIFSVACNT